MIRAEARARLLIAVAAARKWLDALLQSDVRDLDEIAKRERRSERSVRMVLSLAFLSPEIPLQSEALCPRGLGLSDMTDLPTEWLEQSKTLGLSPPET